MRFSIPLAFAMLAVAAVPTLAAPACSGSFALSRDEHSERQINEYNLRLLQSIDVAATRAEIWGGCIRAYVTSANGVEEMQFYEPLTLRRVE